MAHTPQALPPEITVLERDWLSANNIVFQGAHSGTAVVDTGYHSHAEHTVALLGAALHGRALDHILNTHLHSDHCGGNAALQAVCAPPCRRGRWPTCATGTPTP